MASWTDQSWTTFVWKLMKWARKKLHKVNWKPGDALSFSFISSSHLIYFHVNTEETELLDKVKKLLWLMIIFGENISATVGAIVKRNASSLVVSRSKECRDITFSLQVGSIPVPEFLRQLQLITAFPVRPFVLPFLQRNIHRIRQEVNRWEVFLSVYWFSLLVNKLW